MTLYCLRSFTLPSAYTLLFLRHSFLWEDHWRKSFSNLRLYMDTQGLHVFLFYKYMIIGFTQ